jgi:hypothetical protein
MSFLLNFLLEFHKAPGAESIFSHNISLDHPLDIVMRLVISLAARKEMEAEMTIDNPNDADRVEKVRVSQQGSSEYVERVVEDAAAAQRSFTYQLTALMWLMFGALESLLALRVILKLVAANPGNTFASLVYALSDLFVWPFVGLTVTPSAEGIVIEIHTIIAMVVYAILAWLLISLVNVLLYRRTERSVRIERRERLP